MKALDPKAIAIHFGGDVNGKDQVNIPTPGHSKRDRGTSITLKPDAPDGVVVHCHNGSPSDALAVKDQLRKAGFLPKFERAEVWRNDDLRPARVADDHAVHLSPGQRIVATFEYIDLDGHVRYRTHRIEPGRDGTGKEFRYDRPSDGTWLPGLGDELQLPYGLASVALADGAADLYLVEGERKADKLISWGLQALSLKNIDKWFDRFAGFFKGRRVFILPDNDEAGERYAAKAAELVGSSASILRLPGLGDGGDILDWDGGLADLVALSYGASGSSPGVVDTRPFPEPVDLWMRYEEPNLPKGLLPEVIERFAFRQGEIMGADPAGLAMAALTVCAAAIPDSVVLQVKRNDPTWRENARLWTALVGPPSRKKTPIFKAALAPLRSLDNALMRTFMHALSAYEALPAAERKAAERPKQKRLIISDATVEAAQEVLRDSPDGVLSEQDELSGWFGAMDKYAPGKGAQADRAFWLKAFNGGTYNLNRIGRGASQIPNLSICLLGGIQPEPIRKLAADSVDDGLVQRLLPVILKPSAIGRDLPPDGVVREYSVLVERLNRLRPPMIGSYNGECQSAPLHFSSGAKAIRDRLEQEHLDLVTALEFVSPKLASHFGKYDGIFARLCLLWHCIESAGDAVPPDEVSERIAAQVAQFMEQFLRPSAIAFYAGMLGMSAGHEDLLALAAWIVAKRLNEVKAREAQASTQSLRALNSDQVRQLCEKLEAFGWLERVEPGPKSNTPRWLVNPKVHCLFEERARHEQDRRERAREALRSALSA